MLFIDIIYGFIQLTQVSSSYDFEEMEAPVIDYDEEYESDFYTNFDDELFNAQNWSTTWDDPHMMWVQQESFNALYHIIVDSLKYQKE